MMRNLYKRLSLTAGFLLMIASVVLAQERVVTGTVTDETGSTMPGVNILIKGTAQGTASDSDGKFSLSIPGDNATLVFTFVGYANAEIVVGSRSIVNIQLTADVTTLTELVVTGYTTEKKADIIGSVSVVSSKDLLATPSANLTTQLQGRAAGVVVSSSGEPGAAARVRIRGFSSFGNNDPLYVVDGVPTEDPSRINPNDIESIQILKDATSASIYGSRAANGVVIVTTKRGKAGTSTISYDMYYGSQSIPNSASPDMLNTAEYMEFLNTKGGTSHPVFGSIASPVRPDFIVYAGGYNGDPSFKSGVAANHPEANPALYSIKKDGTFQQIMQTSDGTDWFGEISRAAPMQNHQISASGGTEKGNYNVGLNYFDQDGVFLHTNYKRYLVRANTLFNPQSWLRIGENIQVGYEERLGNDNKGEGGAWAMSYRMVPYIPVYDIKGGFGGNGVGDSGNGSNPVANLFRQRDNKNNAFSIFGNVFAEVDIVKGLTYRSSFGLDYNTRSERYITYQTYERSENVNTTQLQEQMTNNTAWTWTNTLTYGKSFGDHTVKLLGGYEAVKSVGRGQNIRVENFDIESEDLISLGTKHTILVAEPANLYRNTLASMFGRVDYMFKDKYIFNATVRRDGSSKFGSDNRYAVFPAFGLGWRLSEESFIQGIDFISDLKLRGGWGQMGSQKNVDSRNSYSTFRTDPSITNYDIGGSNGSSLGVGFAADRRGSTATKWETTTTLNIGLDGSLFAGKLEFSLNWFKNDTEDLLVRRQGSSLEPVLTQPHINIGSMVNKGIDLSLTNRGNITDGLGYNATITLTKYTNEVTRVDADGNVFYRNLDRLSNALVTREGEALSSFEGFEIDGFWTQEQLNDPNRLVMESPTLGSWRYKDQNGDNRIDEDDRVILGSPHPTMQLGANLGLTYKGFDLNAFFFWNYGNEIYNYTKYYTDMSVFVGGVSDRVLHDAWTPENPTGSLPNLAGGYTSFTTTTSNDYYVESGSYLRLRNLQLGYTVPSAISQKVRMQNLRVYIQGQNLFTITEYSGPDPDLNIQTGDPNGDPDLYLGVDRSGFPNTRQLLVGLSLTF